jgi:hypothetical protein
MFEIVLAGVLLMLFIALWLWQNPGLIRGRLKTHEIGQFMSQVEKLPFWENERTEVLQRMRAWLENDDGKPFYMLNLMRYYSELRRFPGAPEFKGSPEESNARYEMAARFMLLKLGGFPLFAGTPQGKNLLEHDPALDAWSRLLLVRYPSRRAFMKLLSRPEYHDIEPYKIMALQVVLTPATPQLVLPSVSLVVGGICLVVFLAIGWARGAGAL